MLCVALTLNIWTNGSEEIFTLVWNSTADAENVGLEDVDDIYKYNDKPGYVVE